MQQFTGSEAEVDLSLTTRAEGGRTVVEVGGEIDVYTAPKLRETIVSLVDAGAVHLVVDLERVEFLDSTGLGVLVGGLKRVRTPRRLPVPGLYPGTAAEDLPDHRPDQGLRDPSGRRLGDLSQAKRYPQYYEE